MPIPLIRLPQDEGLHQEWIEWWYWTTQGHDASGKPISLMFTLFKSGIFGFTNFYFSHQVISDIDAQTSEKQYQVFWKDMDDKGLREGKLSVKYKKDFVMKKQSDGSYRVMTPQFDLTFVPKKPHLLVGGTGKVPLNSHYTYYYTFPHMDVEGTMTIGGTRHKFLGTGWMDHQWSPFISVFQEFCWNWFSFQLSDGTDLQCFKYGDKRPVYLASVSDPDGKTRFSDKVMLKPHGTSWKSKESGAKYQLEWDINLPELDIKLHCKPRMTDQEMIHGPFRYWEGPTTVTGSIGDKEIDGFGFLELNGVPGELKLLEKIKKSQSKIMNEIMKK